MSRQRLADRRRARRSRGPLAEALPQRRVRHQRAQALGQLTRVAGRVGQRVLPGVVISAAPPARLTTTARAHAIAFGDHQTKRFGLGAGVHDDVERTHRLRRIGHEAGEADTRDSSPRAAASARSSSSETWLPAVSYTGPPMM
jgi:hypothetical protein